MNHSDADIHRPGDLADALERFGRVFGGPGIPRPCTALADYHCPNCGKDVRSVSDWDENRHMECPMCGETPGALVIGQGPKERESL